ncbi:hypothetical protein A3Q56_03323 [Intoshia linei]|uniref:Uncharacterized protein n=1 Tax=Intoshia linei TaxID=1819745 RepID=A0A177B5N4_9BILA|nr:hypothetical protein A3Q56_03323 [Intoshia linei]
MMNFAKNFLNVYIGILVSLFCSFSISVRFTKVMSIGSYSPKKEDEFRCVSLDVAHSNANYISKFTYAYYTS